VGQNRYFSMANIEKILENAKIEVVVVDVNNFFDLLDKKFKAFEAEITKIKNQQPIEEEVLSREEAKQLFGVSDPTLNEWRKKGLISGRKIGNRVYYLKTEILQSLKKFEKNG
jgi:predicted site-specific integrase-resolvase